MKSAILWVLGIILLIGSCFLLIIGMTFFMGYVVEGTRPIPGDAANFDPIATYPQVTQFAGDGVKLMYMEMKFVKSDGTLDLTADYGSEVNYYFAYVLDKSPANAAPLGAGGSTNGPYAERIDVSISKPETKGGSKNQYYNFGMRHITIEASPLTSTLADAPTCNLKDLWNTAIKKDAPANAVASIRYDDSGYTFTINDTHIYLQFTSDCQLKS